MKVLIISSSPNEVGLTASTASVCESSLNKEGKNNNMVKHICLNKYNIKRCEACGPRGWGICLGEARCCMEDDDFKTLQEMMFDFDSYVVITPVYFHEMSESAKTFFDRLRRCEAFNEKSKIKGKKVVFIACAGGSGRGTENCLNSMNILAKFLDWKVIKDIPIIKANFEEQKTMEEIKESMKKLI